METIKEGVWPPNLVYTGTCRSCGTKVKFHYKEANRNAQVGLDYLWVDCPLCKRCILECVSDGKPENQTPKKSIFTRFMEWIQNA